VTRPEPPADADVRAALEQLGRTSFADHSLDSLIRSVTELAAGVLPGNAATSVTMLADGRPRTVASSDDLSLELDRVQYRLGDGPCLHAARGEPAEVPDTATDERWPDFSAVAAAAGAVSVLSVPLPVHELVPAGLNVYIRRAVAADAPIRSLATRFAEYAVVPVSNMYLYASAVERAANLQAALDSRAVIDQAKGILMERFRLTPDQAFHALAQVSMQTNRKVREVAERLVETGELPSR
jgi:GAF domain-containing protein